MNIKTNILSVLALIALRGRGEAQTLALLELHIVKLNATVATLEAQIAASNVTVNKELQAGVTLQNEIKSYISTITQVNTKVDTNFSRINSQVAQVS